MTRKRLFVAALAGTISVWVLAQTSAPAVAPNANSGQIMGNGVEAGSVPTAGALVAVAAPAETNKRLLGDAKAGESKAATCGACHNADGNSPAPTLAADGTLNEGSIYPKLAGQHADYIAHHLMMFKNGQRENAVMLGFASTLSEQDMHDVGAYFASKKVIPGVADKVTAPFGESIYRGGIASKQVPACMACHGPTGRGNPGPSYPALAGQHMAYTVSQLKRFRAGTVYGDAKGNMNAAVMSAVAKNLSDQDINALATYLEGLHRQ
jgi:cytochrome c553